MTNEQQDLQPAYYVGTAIATLASFIIGAWSLYELIQIEKNTRRP